jgi:hypothetical protein
MRLSKAVSRSVTSCAGRTATAMCPSAGAAVLTGRGIDATHTGPVQTRASAAGWSTGRIRATLG